MTGLDRASAISFIATGALVTFFGLFSVMGTLTGGAMTLVGLADGNVEIGGVGAVLLLFYGVWMLACMVGGPVQIVAGVQQFRGRPPGALHWVAVAAGLASCITVYCAIPGLVSFALGLASGLAKPADAGP
jgi:hypothetical protein